MSFRHEALLYANREEYLAAALPFIRDGVAAGDAVMVVEPPEKVSMLREQLGAERADVLLLDMSVIGANPALIIPAWSDFISAASRSGRRTRGIGEPIFSARRPEELAECQHHEALLNFAIADDTEFWLLCPYDTAALPAAVIDEALRTHRFVMRNGISEANTRERIGQAAVPFEQPLTPPPNAHKTMSVRSGQLSDMRALIALEALGAGLGDDRARQLVLAVNEVATNIIEHGGGEAVLRVWLGLVGLVCEISDAGRFEQPMVDRVQPPSDVEGSRGLWLASHLCDLIQIRSTAGGTAVRLHMWTDAARLS